MWQKILSFAVPLAALLIVGCSDNSVSPALGPSTAINGETEFVQYADPGNGPLSGGGNSAILKQVSIFRDSSDNTQLTGTRNVVVTSVNQEKSYGTFSLETNDAHWEGSWTGTTTSSGTTIKATGYDVNERGKSCVWYYYLPTSENGMAGTFTARISYERD